ncbi:unnamed protein product [Dracunculus medinensis]|uniref:Alpha-type protein kinase domain-containing protein n=1 Tax=Dracunculus medinensis TaxID=318479 RepID=A0A0N4UIF4_DRAME|nr:unnamed protein product [Dracunculus medinensis]
MELYFTSFGTTKKDALKWVKREENCFEGDSVSTCEFLDTYDEFIQIASGLTTDVGYATNPSCILTQEYKDDKAITERNVQYTWKIVQEIIRKGKALPSRFGNAPLVVHFAIAINSVNSNRLDIIHSVVIKMRKKCNKIEFSYCTAF